MGLLVSPFAERAETPSKVAVPIGVTTAESGLLTCAVQLAVGAPIAGVQITFNIETPSLNSFVYDYQVEC